MDQNQWFNSGSPAPTLDRQAFEAGWTAAQRQMAYSPQVPQINERIFQQTPQQTPPPRPTYLPGRVVNSPDDIRASEIPMDGTGEDEERFLRFTSGNELTAKSWIVSL